MEKTRFKCLILDHDDTTVNSTQEINHPSFCETLAKLRGETLSFEEYSDLCFDLGFDALCREKYGFTADEMQREFEIWQKSTEDRIPTAYDGIINIIRRQRAAGGVVCVASHSTRRVIERDWKHNFATLPDAIYDWTLGEGRRKPAPWPVIDACARFHLEPTDVLVVDDMDRGTLMANAAGARFAAALWAPSTPSIRNAMRGKSDLCFESPRELEDFLFNERP